MRALNWLATFGTGILVGVLFHEQAILMYGWMQGYLKAKGL